MRIASTEEDNSQSIGSLKKIFQDYLEIHPEEPSLSPQTSPRLIEEVASFKQIYALLDDSVLARYFKLERFRPFSIIYDVDEPSEKVFFIQAGNVELVTMSPVYLELTKASDFPLPTTAPPQGMVKRVNKVSSGGIFGEADFFLGKNHR